MPDEHRTCRLLPLGLYDGALNMAVDEALLLSCTAGGPSLTLRFYGWSRPTLSLGYFQDPAEAADHGLADLPAVRRLTGGGAIVHHAEVTYSVVWREGRNSPPGGTASPGSEETPAAPPAPLPAGVTRSYEAINRALAAGLALLGLAVEPGRPEKTTGRSFLCFERRSRHDLVAAGNKVAGSAQRRRAGAVLQHGSILVQPSNERRIRDLSVSEILGRRVSLEEAVEALGRGFEEALGWELRPGRLDLGERHLADGLRHHRYSHLAWGGRSEGRANFP